MASEIPPVTVIMTTYDSGNGLRTNLALQTMTALQQRLIYPDLRWIIADDGSPEGQLMLLQQAFPTAYTTNAQRGGVGKSKNLALTEAFKVSPFVLLLEDDWVLNQPLDLAPHVAVLQTMPNVGMIRMGFLGGTMNASLDSAPELFYSFWRLARGSGVYIYSGQVSLRHKRFYDVVGYHKEGISAGEEEIDMCIRFNGADGVGDCIWPLRFGAELNCSPFTNIGTGTLSLNAVRPE